MKEINLIAGGFVYTLSYYGHSTDQEDPEYVLVTYQLTPRFVKNLGTDSLFKLLESIFQIFPNWDWIKKCEQTEGMVIRNPDLSLDAATITGDELAYQIEEQLCSTSPYVGSLCQVGHVDKNYILYIRHGIAHKSKLGNDLSSSILPELDVRKFCPKKDTIFMICRK